MKMQSLVTGTDQSHSIWISSDDYFQDFLPGCFQSLAWIKQIKISSNDLFTLYCTSHDPILFAYVVLLFVTNFGTAGWMIGLTHVTNGISFHRFLTFRTNWVSIFWIILAKHVETILIEMFLLWILKQNWTIIPNKVLWNKYYVFEICRMCSLHLK